MKKLTFKNIQDFFGDRGIGLKRHYLKKYWNDDENIYWIANNKYETDFSPDDEAICVYTDGKLKRCENTVFVSAVSLTNMYAETKCDELLYAELNGEIVENNSIEDVIKKIREYDG